MLIKLPYKIQLGTFSWIMVLPCGDNHVGDCHRINPRGTRLSSFILLKKKYQSSADKIKLKLPNSAITYVNESLCLYYRELWGKCKSYGWRNKFIHFYHKWTITCDDDVIFFKTEEGKKQRKFWVNLNYCNMIHGDKLWSLLSILGGAYVETDSVWSCLLFLYGDFNLDVLQAP